MNDDRATAPADTEIAVVGIGLRFPDADDLEEFRTNLAAGRDSVGGMPPARAAHTGLDPAAAYLPMGHVADIHTFDHAFFGLSRREAALMDPQQRIALVLAHRALEDAGYAAPALRGRPVAVVFSSALSGYHQAIAEPGPLSGLGNVPFALPARIAHVLGLSGPCYAVDTGCNGSLVAVHHACRELREGAAEYALAGGVSLRPGGLPARLADGMTELLSPDGRCRAFDADANGTVNGEGGAALLLTTLGRARADGAPVHAVIRGSAVRHNGHVSASMSAPSAVVQAGTIEAAWRAAGLDPRLAGYVEAHGSGTRLGDAVELEGLGQVFGTPGKPLPIGSVKTNIGHLDHSAGIAGLVKAVLSVRNAELYPSLHFSRPTGDLDLKAVGLDVVTAPRPWSEPTRLAGVSSHSLGGLNTHCVVQAPPPPPRRTGRERQPRLVGVSARSRTALAQLCADLATALRDGTAGLDDVAHTLNSGRAHYEYRTAVLARDTGDLAVRLAAQATWLRAGAGGDGPPGGVRRRPPTVCLLLSPGAAPYGFDPAPLPLTGDAAAVPAGQVAAYRQLRRWGVAVDTIFSSGDSRWVARFLRGEVAEEALPELAARPSNAAPDTARLVAEAERLAGQGPVVFVELSERGSLGALLTERLGPAGRDGVEVLTVSPDTGGPLGLLGRLYELGADLDWQQVGPRPGTADRLRLPGHPLAATPCWVEPRAALPAHGASPALPTTPEPQTAPPEHAPVRSTPVPEAGPRASVPVSDAEPRASVPVAESGPDPVVSEAGAGPGAPVLVAGEAPDADDTPERWLCGTLGELLHSPASVAPDADYFQLGGNSIIALQLADRVESRYGFRPRLLDFYEYPVVADLAGLIRSHASASGATRLPPVVPQERLATSFGQDRMWFHHQLDEDTTLYNLPMVSHMRGPLDIDAVRGMWHDLAQRHEVLRSNFVEVDGEPVLRIRPELGDFFRFHDVSSAPDPQTEARELVRQAAEHRFDLARDPLVRVLVVRLAPDEHVVQVTMHHAVNDGGSPRIFEQELPELYAARREGRPHRLAPLPVQFRDYAAWQRDLLADSALDGELAYWRKTLRDAPELRLPTDHPRPARKTFEGDLRVFTVEAEVMRGLRQLAARESATLFVVLLAALYVLLARRSGQRDLVVGTPTTGRNRPELQGLIGFFNSTVALRADLEGDLSVAELLHRVRGVVLEALEHQEIPFDRVVNALGGERDPGRTPVFDVFYVHQELPPIQQFEDVSVGHFDAGHSEINLFGGMPRGTAKFDLTLVTSDRAGEEAMTACLEFSTRLFTEATVIGLTREYRALLASFASADGGRRIADLLADPAAPAAPEPAASEPAVPESAAPDPAVLEPPAPEPDVPTDRPRPPAPRYTSDSVTEPLGATLRDRLRGFAAPVDDVLLAGWLTTLSWVSGQDELTVGVPGGAVRADLSDEPDLVGLVARITDRIPRPPGPGPRVVYHGTGAARPDAGTELGLSWSDDGPDGLTLAVHYAPELFDRTTAAALVATLRALLEELPARPGRPVHDVAADLDLLPAGENTRTS